MKKLFSLLLIISMFFVGNIYGTSASDTAGISGTQSVDYTNLSNCTASALANVLNGTTFTVTCDVESNSHLNTISTSSTNSGELLNESFGTAGEVLSPRPYAASSWAFGTNSGDDLKAIALLNSGAVGSDQFYLHTTLGNGDQVKTINTKIIGTMKIDDGMSYGATSDTIYQGTYSDTITVKIVQTNNF